MNRKQRMHIVHQRLIEATRVGRPPAQQPVPSVAIDRRRITLAGLRFMGEEPHPTQIAPEPWGRCIWCGCDSGIDRPFTCSAPDGNGHLFEETKR